MGYELKQFFAHRAAICQQKGQEELARLLLRLGEYADGITKLLGATASSEVLYDMLKENIAFEAEFYPAETVQNAREIMDAFFGEESYHA